MPTLQNRAQIKDTTLWVKSKINDGLLCAGVDASVRNWMEATYVSLPRAKQQALIDAVGGFGLFAAAKDKDKRDLCRAMNAALAFNAIQHGQRYVYDAVWRDKILNRLDLTAARRVVLAQASAAYSASRTTEPMGADEPDAPVSPIKLPQPERVTYAPVLPPPVAVAHPVILAVNLSRQRWTQVRHAVPVVAKHGLLMRAAAKAFEHEGRARHGRIDTVVAQQSGDFALVWATAANTVRRSIQGMINTNLQNLSGFNAAITAAYASFDANIKENQDLLKQRVDLAGKLFEALKHAPPPFSLIGTIGCAVVGLVTVQAGLDPRTRFAALTTPHSSTFFSRLTARLDALRDKLRVGPDLAGITTAGQLQLTLADQFRTAMAEMDEALQATCDEHFGETVDVLQLFHGLVGSTVESNRAKLAGRIGVPGEHFTPHKDGNAAHDMTHQPASQPVAGQANLKTMVCTRIVEYQNALLAEMRPAIELPKRFAPADASHAMEMLLYCNYIVLLYANGNYRLKPVAPAIIDFFKRPKPWAIVAVDTSHADAVKMHRLKYANDSNRKQVLVMFCDWYMKNINPFMLLTGARRNGELVTPQLIKRLCEVQIDRINAAVDAGRVKEKYSANWTWPTIQTAYEGLCRN